MIGIGRKKERSKEKTKDRKKEKNEKQIECKKYRGKNRKDKKDGDGYWMEGYKEGKLQQYRKAASKNERK